MGRQQVHRAASSERTIRLLIPHPEWAGQPTRRRDASHNVGPGRHPCGTSDDVHGWPCARVVAGRMALQAPSRPKRIATTLVAGSSKFQPADRHHRFAGFLFLASTYCVELFPVFLKLSGRAVLARGRRDRGDEQAGEPAGGRGPCDGGVARGVSRRSRHRGVRVRRRKFASADLDGQWLVVSAATPEVNRRVGAGGRAAADLRERGGRPAECERVPRWRAPARRRDGGDLDRRARPRRSPGCSARGSMRCCPQDLDQWMTTARELPRAWRAAGVPMAESPAAAAARR